MELAKIESLLERYFAGNTNLQEEQQLSVFFTSEEVPAHLLLYKPMFEGFKTAGSETSQRSFQLPEATTRSSYWKWGVAAGFVLIAGVAGFMFNNQGLSQEEEQALAAFTQTKEMMFLLSKNLNKGTESLTHIDEFTKGSSNIALINQFTETKNLILK